MNYGHLNEQCSEWHDLLFECDYFACETESAKRLHSSLAFAGSNICVFCHMKLCHFGICSCVLFNSHLPVDGIERNAVSPLGLSLHACDVALDFRLVVIRKLYCSVTAAVVMPCR